MTADGRDRAGYVHDSATDAAVQTNVVEGTRPRGAAEAGVGDGSSVSTGCDAGDRGRNGPTGPPRAPMLRVLPGTPHAASAARQLALELLGAAHPAADTVMLLISELVTNAIVHSGSGAAGGTLTVALCPGAAGVLIQVCDAGGPSEPYLSAIPAEGAEHGYGLLLVDALADTWGTLTSPEGRVTWCRVGGGEVPESGS